ncbi:MAG: DUF11 domain-containing protein [Proteobacteria bacterium]|nr:DUF11 domain-containing protein [Pseudomonadota bacterium]
MKRLVCTLVVTSIAVLLLFSPSSVFAWPADSDWMELTKGSLGISDIEGDSQGGANDPRDIVTNDGSYPAAYVHNDGTFMYFRIRVDGDPLNQGGDGLDPFGWGLVIDTDNDFSDYEWMVMLDGISNPERIFIGENTAQSVLGDPSDHIENVAWEQDWVLNVNFRSILADSTTNGGADYFLDFRLPYDSFKTATGLNDTSPIRFFIGSSNNSQALTADLVDISDTCSTDVSQCMPTNGSDTYTPLGTYPSDGSVKFVSDIAGTGDVTQIYAGDTVYIKVTDADVNNLASIVQSFTVIVETQTGDTETVIVTETGPDTGIFTGSTPSAAGAVSDEDGTLQVAPIEAVTVTYVDSIDAAYDTYENRTDTLTVQMSADLSVTKIADKTTPNEGGTVVYTIEVTNNGPGDTTGIQVTDSLPAGLSYVSDDGGGSYNSGNGVWQAPSLTNGTSASLNITVTVDSGTLGTTIDNTASITASVIEDPVSGNDSATKSITVGGSDLAVTKSVDTTTPASGGSITFTVGITNNGNNDATNVELTDLLPAGLSFSSYSSTFGSYSSSTGVWQVGDLAVSASQNLTIDATVPAAAGSTITNTASVSASDQADSNTSNNSASVIVYVSGADLRMSKSVNDATPNEGDTISYTVTVTNDGPYSADSIIITDLLPSGLSFSAYSATFGTYSSGSGEWGSLSIANGGSETLTIDATVDVGTGGTTIANTASVTASGSGDPDSSDNSASASITVEQADLSLTKTASDSTPPVKSSYSYSVVLTNNGPDDATNIEVTDIIDTSHLIFDSYSSTAGTPSYADPTLTWTVAGPLAPGDSETLTINVSLINNIKSGVAVQNVAEISSADQADNDVSNNISIANIVVDVAEVDFSITKSADSPAPVVGATVTYTVVVSNNSVDTNGTGVEVRDVLPDGLTFSGYSSTQGSYSSDSWSAGDIGFGQSESISISATVDTGTDGNTITNTARIYSSDQYDDNFSNDVAEAAIVVGATDLSLSKTVDNSSPNEGDSIIYTLIISNGDLNNATSVEVTDILPSGVSFTGYSSTFGTYSSGTGLWSVGSLAVSSSETLTIMADVDTGSAGSSITNTASVTSADQADTDSSNDSASIALTVQQVDVYVTKVASDSVPDELDTITYTITVGNIGPNAATNLVVTDILPAGVIYQSDTPSQGSYDDATGLWTVGSLAKLATATLTITVDVGTGTGGSTITNTASITAVDQADSNSSNNSASAAISPVSLPAPDIVILKMVQTYSDPINGTVGPKAIPGAIMEYTVIVTNTGIGEAENVVITDIIPANSEFYVNDIGGAGSGPAIFTDGATASGMTYSFVNLGDGGDSLEFYDSTDALITPAADGNGVDSSVAYIKVLPSNNMDAAAGGNNPSFSLRFRVRIK